MSYTQNKTSSRSLRDRAHERFAHADERKGGPRNGQIPLGPSLGPEAALEKVASYWWVELLLGVFWVVISLVVLKFNQASVTTVGILTGLMFLLFAAQESVLAAVDRPRRWLWVIFSVLLAASGIVALVQPTCHVRRIRRHPRLRVPDHRRDVDGAGVHRAADQRPVVADA